MEKLTKAQEKVVNHDEGNILISASAGSGKTHTMIERVIRLILEGSANVEQILAVTFTEKAAADMKEKLKKALVKTYEKERKPRLLDELNKIPASDISTIHSFCARLIRTYFYKVGVSPDFKIADEADSSIIVADCLERTFREFYASKSDRFLDLVDKHAISRRDGGLKELVYKAYEFCGNETDPDEIIEQYKKYFTEEGVEVVTAEYKRVLDKKIKPCLSAAELALYFFDKAGLIKGKAFAEQLVSDIKEALASADVYALKKFDKYGLRAQFENKLDEEALLHKSKAVAARDKFKDAISDACKNLTDKTTEKQRVGQYYEHAERFGKVLKRFSEMYAAEKREENLLDFSDLEHFALKILRDEEAAAEISEKYKFIFIDEYQDVNSVQEEILNSISKNNLLMVGDLKQGIYAFRGCRSEIFAEKLSEMPKRGEEVVRLNENFRSAKKVINTVNEIFNFCMTDARFDENYKNNAELVFGGLFPEGYDGRTELHFLKKSSEGKRKETPRVYDVLEEILKPDEKEDDSVSSLLTEIIREELSKTIYDVKLGTERRVQLKDIAVLTRAKKGEYVANIVKGLTEHGIAVVADAKENVCDFPEIAMLVGAVRLIDCFEQDVPLASTLKSPIGGFTDEDLFDIVKFYRSENERGTFFDAYAYFLKNGNGELRLRLEAFDAYFKKIRFLSEFLGAYGALDAIVKDKALESYLLAETFGKAKVLRLKRFISAAVVGGRRLTVKEFLRKIETGADSFGMFECGDDDAVRVMTMHASKGLEFPVVIVCGLERKFDSRDDTAEILLSRKYGFVPRYYDEEKRTKERTLFRGLVTAEQGEERIKEEMRLFYVAATRATYSLHLVFSGSKDSRSDEFTSATKFSDFIPARIPATERLPEEFDFIELKKGRRKVVISGYDEKRVEALKERFALKYPYLADTALPLKSSVTAATKNFEEDIYDARVLFTEDETDVETGTAAHEIMEKFDFSSHKTVSELTEDLIAAGVLDRERAKKVNIEKIEKAILSAGLKNLSGKELYREKGFLTEIKAKEIFPEANTEETVVLQGVIDLLAIDGDTAEIIDYKYSVKSKDALVGKYKKQLELYAYAVEKVLGKKVVSKKIINIFTGEWAEIT